MLWRRSVLLMCMWICIAGIGQSPMIRELEVDVGPDRPVIRCIDQDLQGAMWLGTDLGLIRTDGVLSQVMLSSKGSVTAICPDGDGMLAAWSNGTITRSQGGSNDDIFEDSTLIEAPSRDLIKRNEQIWVATYGSGVLVLEAGRVLTFNTGNGLRDDHIHSLVDLGMNGVAVATDQGVVVIDPESGHMEHFTQEDGLPDNLVTCLEQDLDGTLLVGTHGGDVARIDVESKKVGLVYGSALENADAVHALVVDRSSIWIATQHSGVLRLMRTDTGGKGAAFNTAGGMGSPVHQVYMDMDGGVWYAQERGTLVRIEPGVQVITDHEGHDLRDLSALAKGSGNTLWLAKGSTVLKHAAIFDHTHEIREYPLGDQANLEIVSLHEDALGQLWVGTFGHGVILLDTANGSTTLLNQQFPEFPKQVLAISSNNSDVWFATLDGLWRSDLGNASSIHFEKKNIPGSGFLYDVLCMPNGEVIVATDGEGTLKVMKDGTVRSLGESARAGTFYSLCSTDDGVVWAIGPGTGFDRLTDYGLEQHGIIPPALEELVHSIEAIHGLLIAFTEEGLVTLDPITDELVVLGDLFGIDGKNARLNSTCVDQNGAYWAATTQGLYRCDLTRERLLAEVPAVITGISSAGRQLVLADRITLTGNYNPITIHFSGRLYTAPEELRFHFKMLGFDTDVRTTRDRSITYSNLPPGEYTFNLQASLVGSTIVGPGKEMALLLKAPFIQRPWVITTIVVALIAMLLLYLRRREVRRNREQRLEKEKLLFQYEAIRSQVNPHFLFNSFNTLIDVIEKDQEKAVSHVEALSDLFRSILQVRSKDTIDLGEEIRIATNYFQLEQRRFGDSIQLDVNVPEHEKHHQVPPLILQLLLENAIKHTRIEEGVPLLVEVWVEEEQLIVRNPHRPRSNGGPSTGYGLESIRKRLGTPFNRSMTAAVENGYFVVRVPLKFTSS